MLPSTQAVLRSWSVPPAASFALALTAIIYLRGWLMLRRAGVPFIPLWRAFCFLLGLFTLWFALASPLDTFSAFLITAHMLQHMLLMMAAPPLLLLGAPLVPLVRGLPVFARREFAGPFVRWRVAVRTGRALTNLWVALVLMGVAMFSWHTPRLYELALRSSSWHDCEHACFFLASLIFWWPVVQPWPSRAQAPRWAIVPYLLLGDLQNTILSAILVFGDRVLYPSYEKMPRLFGLSALQDQAAAGAIMWVMGSLAFLVPAVIVGAEVLSSKTSYFQPAPTMAPQYRSGHRRSALPFRIPALSMQEASRRRFEAIIFIVPFVAVATCFALVASRSSDDDDQVLRMRQTSGRFTVSVFTPQELLVGSNTFEVLVQDHAARDVLTDAQVQLRTRHNEDSGEAPAIAAGADDSDNKLLNSADLNFSSAGEWLVAIVVHEGSDRAEFALPLHVTQPEPGFAMPWPYFFAIILTAILAFVYVVRHRGKPAHPQEDRATAELELARKAQ